MVPDLRPLLLLGPAAAAAAEAGVADASTSLGTERMRTVGPVQLLLLLVNARSLRAQLSRLMQYEASVGALRSMCVRARVRV